jgi:signal peptidase I
MSTSGGLYGMVDRRWPGLLEVLPTFPEMVASLLRTVVVALFVLTFIMEPFLIPSESMERTLLVGDFLLSNRQVFAPAGPIGRWILPYQKVKRGDIVVFYHPRLGLLVKRAVAVPGDRLRIVNARVFVNGEPLKEPYACFEPAAPDAFANDFPPKEYTDPAVDPEWWRRMQNDTHDGWLTVPPGDYFVLGDNRNHSDDSRFWGFVPRRAIFAEPLVIYFSVRRASGTDRVQALNDKLAKKQDFAAKVRGFARWGRIFRVVH